MLNMVAYYVNFYRKLGDVFGKMIHADGGRIETNWLMI